MITPGYECRVPGFSAVDVTHTKLKRAVDEAGARFRAAGPKLDEARDALLEALTASVTAQKTHGNLATIYVDLYRGRQERNPEADVNVPACTEELDAVVVIAFAEFAAARKEYDEANVASRDANAAFGQHLGHTGR